MQGEEWGCRVLAAALRRIRPQLAAGLRVQACRLSRCGEFWSVRVECRLLAGPAGAAGPVLVSGRGTARLRDGWLPGDPRAVRRLQLALAHAVAEVAEGSGRGLALWRGQAGRPASRLAGPRAPAAPGAAAVARAAGSGR